MAGNIFDDALEQLPPAPGVADDPFGAAAEQVVAGRLDRQKTAIDRAADVAPDTAADVISLAKRYQLPESVVERNFDTLRRRAQQDDTPHDQILRDTPATADYLSDAYRAAAVGQDREALGTLEKTVRVATNSFRALASGPPRALAGLMGVLESYAESNGNAQLAAVARMHREEGLKDAAFTKGAQAGAGELEQAFYGGFESLGVMLPGAVLSLMTGTPAPMIALAGGTTAGESYGRGREAGLSVDRANLHALTQGGIEVATEFIPAKFFVKDLLAGSGFGKMVLRQLAGEIPGEQVATALQDLDEWATFNPEKPFADYLAERPSAAAATLVSTITSVGAMTAIASAAQAAAGTNPQVARAEEGKTFFDTIAATVAGMKSAEKHPQSIETVIANATKGTPAEKVYAPLDTFTTYWQGLNEDPAAKAAELTGDPHAYENARRTGADLAIPTSTYAAKLAATEHNDFFTQELRLAPDQMNLREAAAFKERETAAAQADADEAQAATPAGALAVALRQQLEGAGVEGSTARDYAELVGSVVGEVATRTGVDPSRLVRGIAVERPDLGPPAAPAAPPVAEPTLAEEPDVDALPADVIETLQREGFVVDRRVADRRTTPADVETEQRAAEERRQATGAFDVEAQRAMMRSVMADRQAIAGGRELMGRLAQINAERVKEGEPALLDKKGQPLQTVEVVEGTDVNASGESAASAEAISRLAGMTARGEQFVVYDRAGNARPIVGADAVDYQARTGETFGILGPDGFQVLDDKGGKFQHAGTEQGPNRIADQVGSPVGGRVAASDPGTNAKRRDAHIGRVFNAVFSSAQQLDPAVNEADLKAEFDYRLALYQDLQQTEVEAANDPRDLLRTIAKYGGLFEPEGSGQHGELVSLGAGAKFGALAGVPGVFAKKKIATTANQKSRGHGLDVMLQMLHQEARWQHIESIDMLVDILDDIARGGLDAVSATKLPGTEELRDIGIRRELQWWSDPWRPADLLDDDAIDDRELIGDVDTSFNIQEFSQGLFDEFDALEDPKDADTLTTPAPEVSPTSIRQGSRLVIDGIPVEVLSVKAGYVDVAPQNQVDADRAEGREPGMLGGLTSYKASKVRELFAAGRIVVPGLEADVLDTGEVQSRLPGAGQVREREVATPEIADVPFSLTAPVAKPSKKKNAGQTTLFQGITEEQLQEWAADVHQRHRDAGLKSFAVAMTRAGDLALDALIVERGSQRAGLGSTVMRELTRFADANGLRIVLSPALPNDHWGTTSRARLVKFYKRFGFVENKGRHKDFRLSAGMFREPSVPTPAAIGKQTESPAFKEWFGASKVVDEDGDPLRVFHGTNASFTAFDRERANVESDFGAGFYFSSEPEDVANNYAGLGPDMTSRLELEIERTHDRYAFDETETELKARIDHWLEQHGIDPETATPEDRRPAYREIAAKKLGIQHGGLTMPVYLKMENPAIVGGDNETQLTIETEYPPLDDFQEDEIAELREQGLDDDEIRRELSDRNSYDPKQTGTLVAFAEGLREVAGEFSDADIDAAIGELMEAAGYESIGLERAIEVLRKSEGIQYATDDTGNLAATELIRRGLEEAGFDGVIDQSVDKKFGSQRRVGQSMKGMNPDTVHYIAFKATQIKSAIGNRGTFAPGDANILFQDPPEKFGGTDRRGAIRFGPERQFTISLLEKADLTTFLHESAHMFLEVFGDAVDQIRGGENLTELQQKAIADYDTLLEWFGVADRAGIGTEQHEQFARGFEAYLMEGKAPSPRMRDAFARFRAWMIGVYRSLKGLRVSLTPDVRRVMDRMVASDAEIAAAEAEGTVAPMFTTPEMAAEFGIKPEEFRLYRATVADASNAAREQLTQQMLAEVRREQEATWKAQRADVHAAVEAETHAMPVYIALAAMQRGTTPAGDPMWEGAAKLPIKLSRQVIVDRFGADRLKRLPRPFVYTKDGGIDPDAAATMFGYTSGDELLKALEGAEPMRQRIERETDRRMLEQHGSMLLDGTVPEKAKAALANDHREAIIRAELRALARKRREVGPFARAAATAARQESQEEIDALARELKGLKAERRAGVSKLAAAIPPAETIRDAAKLIVSRMTIREIRPHTYWSAARQAGQKAIEAALRGDLDTAIQAKQHELMSLAVFREASRAKTDAEDRVQAAKDLGKPPAQKRIGKAGASYLEQVNTLLDRYDFARQTGKVLDRRESLRLWVDAMKAQDIPVEIADDVIDDARRIHYSELTVEELVGVTDALKHIEHLAGLKGKLLANAEQREFDVVRDQLADSIRMHNAPNKFPIAFRRRDRFKRKVKDLFASHARIGTLANVMDAGEGGAVWSAFVRPANEAATKKAERQAAAAQEFAAIMRKHYPGTSINRLHDKLHIPMIGDSLTLDERIAVARNWGNETSRDRLLNDPRRKWNQAQIQAILDTLDANDLAFVQATFDFVDQFWPEIAAKQKRVTGLEPEKVEAMEIATKAGTIRGGYFPLVADSRYNARTRQWEKVTEADLKRSGAYVASTTKRGHVETRVKHARYTVKLEGGVIFSHIEQVVHDLTHHEMLIDATRLLRDDKVADAFYETVGDVVYDQFTTAMEAIAAGRLEGARNMVDEAAQFMKTRVQVGMLGYNLWTGLQQPLGLFNGAERVGAKWIAKGLFRWLTSPARMERTVKWIHETSPYMAGRANNATQEIADLRRVFAQPGGWFDTAIRKVTGDVITQQRIMDSFLWHIGLMQRVADVPTWLGQYEKSKAQGETDDRAVALADQAVIDAQGSGRISDLAKVQRGGPVAQLYMTFYSYGSTTFNASYRRAGRTNFRSPWQVTKFLGGLSLIYVFPAVGTVLLAGLVGRDDDEDEDFAEFLTEVGKESVGAALNGMVLVRELGGAISKGTRGYSGPAGARLVQMMTQLIEQAKQGELDDAAMKKALEVGGVFAGLPMAQIQKTIDGWRAFQDDDAPITSILFGPPREE